MAKRITKIRLKEIDEAVQEYEKHRTEFDHLGRILLDYLLSDSTMSALIHSGKFRSKSPDRLRDKLIRKEEERVQKKQKTTITKNNLFKKIHDLAGVRLLHLHTQQMENLIPLVDLNLDFNNYKQIEDPVVYTWDIEHSDFFKGLGIKPVSRPEMYTSVHYVLSSPQRPKLRIELQIRTLMEEVWGEVSHLVNYPHPTSLKSCEEQLKVLARLTSGCSRLVDSIFSTKLELEKNNGD